MIIGIVSDIHREESLEQLQDIVKAMELKLSAQDMQALDTASA